MNTLLSSERLVRTTKNALLSGGAVLKKAAQRKKQVVFKSERDPVTQVDLAIEKTVISRIQREFPTHSFLAEESAYRSKLSDQEGLRTGYQWIIDPLDGTVNFVHGIPQSCVSIAVALDGQVLAGGVFDPYKDELFLAARGKGATLNGRKISVSKEKKMIRSILVTGFPYQRQHIVGDLMKTLGKALSHCADVRRFGSAALDLSWVACGRFDGYWESNLHPWDVAAGVLLVQEAGGKVTDFQGRSFRLDRSDKLTATNGLIHSNLVKITR